MRRGVNKVIILGHVGNEPEQRFTQNNTKVVTLSLATSEQWKDQQTNETHERTEWHRVVFFGRLAEIVGDYVHKGRQIYIEGRLQTRKWQDQRTGQDRYSTEVIANQLQLIGGRDSDQRSSRQDSFDRGSGDYYEPSYNQEDSRRSEPAQQQDNSSAGQDIDDIPW